MATAATSPTSWRFVFGNTENWAQPEWDLSGIAAIAEEAPTWRVIFGNTAAWLPPQLESPATRPGNALADLCELCRQPISEDEDFIANSAGERPTHTRCLKLESAAAAEQEPAPRRWLSMLRHLLEP